MNNLSLIFLALSAKLFPSLAFISNKFNVVKSPTISVTSSCNGKRFNTVKLMQKDLLQLHFAITSEYAVRIAVDGVIPNFFAASLKLFHRSLSKHNNFLVKFFFTSSADSVGNSGASGKYAILFSQ